MTSCNISFLMLNMVNHLVKNNIYDVNAKATHSKSDFSRLTTNFIIDTMENQSPA